MIILLCSTALYGLGLYTGWHAHRLKVLRNGNKMVPFRATLQCSGCGSSTFVGFSDETLMINSMRSFDEKHAACKEVADA